MGSNPAAGIPEGRLTCPRPGRNPLGPACGDSSRLGGFQATGCEPAVPRRCEPPLRGCSGALDVGGFGSELLHFSSRIDSVAKLTLHAHPAILHCQA